MVLTEHELSNSILYSDAVDAEISEYLKDPDLYPPFEIDKYLAGNCDMFAIAVSILYGLRIHVIMEPRLVSASIAQGLVHAYCCFPNSTTCVIDAKGVRPLLDIHNEYRVNPECWTEEITVDSLHKFIFPDTPINARFLDETCIFVKRHYEPMILNMRNRQHENNKISNPDHRLLV